MAERLAVALESRGAGPAAVLPMDGFHLDDGVLETRGWRARKGAPHTFDVAGFDHLLARVAANTEDEIAVPVFDRSLELARAGARIIGRDVRHVIVEGNYLLLDEPHWAPLRRHFDVTVALHVPLAILSDRLSDRWADLSPTVRQLKIEANDLPNARLVTDKSVAAQIVIEDA